MRLKKIWHSILLFIAVCLPGIAAAEIEIGTIVFASGEVQVVDVDSRKRFVIKGDLIFANETLVTGDGRVQVKFSDDGRVSLKPNTIYSVSEYFYDESELEPVKSFFELVTGTVRFVTGKIAKRNRASFNIKTQTATIGVRGSSGEVTSCVDRSCRGQLDGTYLKTYEGILTIKSGDSQIDVHPNESAFCDADGSGCTKTAQAPSSAVETIGPNLGPNYQQGDQVDHSHGPEEYSPPVSPPVAPPEYTPPSNRGGYSY